MSLLFILLVIIISATVIYFTTFKKSKVVKSIQIKNDERVKRNEYKKEIREKEKKLTKKKF